MSRPHDGPSKGLEDRSIGARKAGKNLACPPPMLAFRGSERRGHPQSRHCQGADYRSPPLYSHWFGPLFQPVGVSILLDHPNVGERRIGHRVTGTHS